jgi:hypothetical protein
MLTIESNDRARLCDGVSRRRMIQVGTLGAFGISLRHLLGSEARASEEGKTFSKKSVILIWQHGGPSQLDTFDMKPDAPLEVRGPYRPISTNLPGLEVSELCPEQAKVMDKCTVIRSFTHGNGDHWAAAHWMLTGRTGACSAPASPACSPP